MKELESSISRLQSAMDAVENAFNNGINASNLPAGDAAAIARLKKENDNLRASQTEATKRIEKLIKTIKKNV